MQNFWILTKLRMFSKGIYVVASLYTKHDFVIEIPLSHDPLSLGMDMSSLSLHFLVLVQVAHIATSRFRYRRHTRFHGRSAAGVL